MEECLLFGLLPSSSGRDLRGFMHHGGRTSGERQRSKRGGWWDESGSQRRWEGRDLSTGGGTSFEREEAA